MKSIKEMLKDVNAAAKADVGIDIKQVVSLCVGLIVVAALVPTAVTMFFDADATKVIENYPSLENLWKLIPLMVILSIAVGIIYSAIKAVPGE